VVKVAAKVEKEGKVTIPAKLISNFSNNLPSGENVTLELADQSLKIKSGAYKAVLKGLSANDFPLIPRKKTEFILKLQAATLKQILAKIMVSTAVNEARVELTGVNLIFSPQTLTFAATDSFRLAEYSLKIDDASCNKEIYKAFIEKRPSIIVPANTLTELSRIIPNDSDGFIEIYAEEGQIFFEFEGTRLVSRLVNGKFPEYKHIMPKEYKSRIVGEKSALLSAVKMASVFASSRNSEISLKIDASAKKVLIGAKSAEVGENSTELKFDIVGPSQEVVFNARYLLDGINTISSSKLAVLLNSESTPVGIKEINEQTGEILDGYTYIVMPIKA
jgi:DNA polymerase-3 subunit beta